MARTKRSLSSLLDGDSPEAVTPEPVVPPVALAVAPPPLEEPSESAGSGESVDAPADIPDSSTPGNSGDASAEKTVLAPDVGLAGEPASTATEAVALEPDFPAVVPVAALKMAVSEPKPARPRAAASVRAIKAAPEPPPSLPLYLELTRKEARFRQDQLNDLTTLTRQLNRRRASTGERITDNTLIRVAVDMLLKVADALDGATEAELLSAVSTRLKP